MKFSSSTARNCILTMILPLLSITTSNAQSSDNSEPNHNFQVGVRFMPTFTALDLNTSSGGTVKGDVTLGFGAGALIGVYLSEHIGIQGEFIYSTLSQEYNDVDVSRKIKLTYFNVPLLFTLNSGKSKVINLKLVAGPQIGFNLKSSININDNGNNTSEAIVDVKKSDFGFAYGAGADIALNKKHTILLSLGYRGVLGLLDIGNSSKSSTSDNYYVLERTNINTNAAYIGLTFPM